jgi:MFS family permease
MPLISRVALTVSVIAMALPTFLIGLLPTYQQIGVAAPILLTVLRLAQGLSVGGEYTTSFIFLVEHAPSRHRGLFGSFSFMGVAGGILLGSAVGAMLTTWLDAQAIVAWGWRVPFIIGIAVGLTGLYIRRQAGIGLEGLAARRNSRQSDLLHRRRRQASRPRSGSLCRRESPVASLAPDAEPAALRPIDDTNPTKFLRYSVGLDPHT